MNKEELVQEVAKRANTTQEEVAEGNSIELSMAFAMFFDTLEFLQSSSCDDEDWRIIKNPVTGEELRPYCLYTPNSGCELLKPSEVIKELEKLISWEFFAFEMFYRIDGCEKLHREVYVINNC